VLQLRDRYVTHKPRDNALGGIAAAVLACALLFGCVRCSFVHDATRSLSAPLTQPHSWYEFFDRRRSMRINQRLMAYVRQLEQARAVASPPAVA
jgi:hypothetical protein